MAILSCVFACLVVLTSQTRLLTDIDEDISIGTITTTCPINASATCTEDCERWCLGTVTNRNELRECARNLRNGCEVEAAFQYTRPVESAKICTAISPGSSDKSDTPAGWLWEKASTTESEIKTDLYLFLKPEHRSILDNCLAATLLVGMGGDPVLCYVPLGGPDRYKRIPYWYDEGYLKIELTHLIDSLVNQARTIAIQPDRQLCTFTPVESMEWGIAKQMVRGYNSSGQTQTASSASALIAGIGLSILGLVAVL